MASARLVSTRRQLAIQVETKIVTRPLPSGDISRDHIGHTERLPTRLEFFCLSPRSRLQIDSVLIRRRTPFNLREVKDSLDFVSSTFHDSEYPQVQLKTKVRTQNMLDNERPPAPRICLEKSHFPRWMPAVSFLFLQSVIMADDCNIA